MGILSKKEQILDVILTDKGRDLLSKNNLNFTYYVFSDDGVDYSGSLSSSLGLSSSFEDYIYQSFVFEPGSNQEKLNNYLYTVDAGTSLPKFVTNIDDTPSFSLRRLYELSDQFLSKTVVSFLPNPEAVVVKVSTKQENRSSIEEDYGISQHISKTKEIFFSNLEDVSSIIGQRVGVEHVVVDADKVLNVRTGEIIQGDVKIFVENQLNNQIIFDYDQNVEIVTGRDSQIITFDLSSNKGSYPVVNGFLVEIYDSGSDGRIKKLKREDTLNVLEQTTVEKGFENYIDIEVDT